MFPKEQKEIEYKGKKFTVEAFSVLSTINLTARIRRANIKQEEDEMLNIILDMVKLAVVKPKLKDSDLKELSADDLLGLCAAACEANGFMAGSNVLPKKPQPKPRSKKRRKKS